MIRKKQIFHQIKKYWNEFEKSNKTIPLNILYVPHDSEEKSYAYKSKHNLKRKNHVIPLMISDGEKWNYLTVKNYQHYLEE